MTTQFLQRPEGRIAYELHGMRGPLVICVPGLGDLRDEYRLAVPALVAANYRVATMDVRGHGESDATFSDYSAAAVGSDIVALIAALGADRASLAGTSMAAAAAVWAAAEVPERVHRLVLIGPFVRDIPMPAFKRWFAQKLPRVLFAPRWGAWLWPLAYSSLYRASRPADFAAYRRRLRASFAEPARRSALVAMIAASKAECEARLASVRAPALIVMGSADPDFPDPAAEASYIARQLRAEVLMVEGAGHYPHVEAPERAMPRWLAFIGAKTSHAA